MRMFALYNMSKPILTAVLVIGLANPLAQLVRCSMTNPGLLARLIVPVVLYVYTIRWCQPERRNYRRLRSTPGEASPLLPGSRNRPATNTIRTAPAKGRRIHVSRKLPLTR